MAKSDRLKGKKTLQVSGFLDEFEKDDIKKDIDIVSLFQHFGVQLTKKGNSHFGLCPWHDDTNPSLSVDKAKGLYNCFGCGESGDIFSLTEKMKGVGFRDALAYLKDFAGKNDTSNKKNRSLKTAAPRPQGKPDDRDTAENTDTAALTDIRRGAEPVGAETKTGTPGVESKPSAGDELNPAKIPATDIKAPTTTKEKAKPAPGTEKSGSDESPGELPSPLPEITLSKIADYYHKRLFANPKALAYLEERGLSNPQICGRFQIGFVDGSLSEKLSEAQTEALKTQGVVTEKGREHFENCITVPIVDSTSAGPSAGIGVVVGMYGRSIEPPPGLSLKKGEESKKTKRLNHLYLKGKHKGIFNRKASKVYDEIILTESIIDSLSLIQLGIENTQSIYGTNGFTDEHLKILKNDRVKKVIIALDADEAGKAASLRLKETLLAEGFSVQVIAPPSVTDVTSPPIEGGEKAGVGRLASDCPHPEASAEGGPAIGGNRIEPKDWNDYLIAGGTAESVKELIKQTTVFVPEAGPGLTVTKSELGYIFTTNEITYRVTGVKEMFVTSLRVNIKAQENSTSEVHYDNADLYAARSRNGYARALAGEFGIEQKVIERDLIKILEYFERERDRKLREGRSSTEEYELTEEEKRLGMELLTSPDLFDEVVRDMETLGYVGEENNKLIVWLAAVSRLLEKPLSVFIQSPPSTGKSYLLEVLLKLLPPESAEWITSVSDQSFNYMDDEDFLDKIFMLGEALHNEIIEGYIRQMQSENKLSRKVVLKDPKTGTLKTVNVKHIVRLVFMMTSTSMAVNMENLSRCLVLRVDGSKAQTEKVLAMQRYRAGYEGTLADKHVVPAIVKKHQAAQRLLKKIPVFNPFEGCLDFPSTRAVMRRGQQQFLSLIAASCVARQMQKTPAGMTNPYTGETDYAYECDYIDYDMARRLFIEGKLLQQDDDLSPAVIFFYEKIRKMARERAGRQGLETTEISFIQTDVREITDLSASAVKQYLRILVAYEYLEVLGGKRHGTRFSYRVREDKPVGEIDLSLVIPPVEDIKRMMEDKRQKAL